MYVHNYTYVYNIYTYTCTYVSSADTPHTTVCSLSQPRFLLSLSFTPLMRVQTDSVLKHIRLYHVFSALIRPASVIPSPSLSSTRFYEMVLSTCVIYPRPPFVPPTHSTLPSLLPSPPPPPPSPPPLLPLCTFAQGVSVLAHPLPLLHIPFLNQLQDEGKPRRLEGREGATQTRSFVSMGHNNVSVQTKTRSNARKWSVWLHIDDRP